MGLKKSFIKKKINRVLEYCTQVAARIKKWLYKKFSFLRQLLKTGASQKTPAKTQKSRFSSLYQRGKCSLQKSWRRHHVRADKAKTTVSQQPIKKEKQYRVQQQRLGFIKRFYLRVVKFTDYALPLSAWHSTKDVFGGILIASLIINILTLVFPLALLQVYDRIIPNQAIVTLVLLVLVVVVSLIFSALLRIARSYVGAWADARFEHLVGCKAFNTLTASSLLEYNQIGTGEHLKRMNAINTLRDFYAGQAVISLVDVPFVVIFLLLIAYIAGWLVLVPIFILLVFIVTTLNQTSNLYKNLSNRREQDDRRMNFIIQTLSNIHTVKSITMESQMLRRYERLQKTSSISDYDVSILSSMAIGQSLGLSQLTIALVVAFGSILVIHGDLTVGSLAACTLLSGRCLQPINSVINVWNRLQSITIARDELQQALDMPAEQQNKVVEIGKIQGEIELNNMSFRYSADTPLILNDISLKIPAKSSIGISGEGLGGKSTLMMTILGLIKPCDGQVKIDGKDIFEYSLSSLRQQIAYMPQIGVIFQGTIMENLTMFDNDKYGEIALKIADRVGLTAIIEHFPDGYETKIGNQSIESLPSGIKQRITIARALIRRPAIVLFDDANVSIDIKGDEILKELLKELIKISTVIIVSHRPSILNLVDKQYKLSEGKLTLLEKST